MDEYFISRAVTEIITEVVAENLTATNPDGLFRGISPPRLTVSRLDAINRDRVVLTFYGFQEYQQAWKYVNGGRPAKLEIRDSYLNEDDLIEGVAAYNYLVQWYLDNPIMCALVKLVGYSVTIKGI